MRKRALWLTCALLSFALCLAIAYAMHDQWQIYDKGNLVNVKIVALPNSLATTGALQFEYQGRIYSKNSNGTASLYWHVGDTIQMKYLQGHSGFLYSQENPTSSGVFVVLMLSASGICFVYYALKKTPISVTA